MGEQDEIPKLKVAVYIRVSTKEQEEMFGEKAQLSRIRSYIQARADLELAGEEYIYKDLAVSGADLIEEREGMTRLYDDLENMEDKPFDIVMVFKIDRFARKLSVLLEIIEKFKIYDVGFISTQESLDTSSPFGTAMLGILGVFAELERDMILERTYGGNIEAKKAGRWQKDKFGYRRDEDNRPIIQDEEAELIQEIFAMYLHGRMTPAEIGRKLTDEKELVPRARPGRGGGKTVKEPYFWRSETIRDILRDEVYIGNFYYNKTKTVLNPKTKKTRQVNVPKKERQLSEITHTPIVEKRIFEQVQEKIQKKTRSSYSKSNVQYILSGLLRCDCCKKIRKDGMLTRVGTKSSTTYQYMCTGKNKTKFGDKLCKTIPLPKRDLEALVMYYVKQFLLDPNALDTYLENHGYKKQVKRVSYKKLNKVENNIIKYETIINNAKELFIAGDLDKKEYTDRKQSASEEIRLLKKEKQALKADIRKQVDVKKYKKSFKVGQAIMAQKLDRLLADDDKMQRLLGYLIEEIVIKSRPKKTSDVVAGRKKRGQKIPYQLIIKFRLPQDYLNELLYAKDFLPRPNAGFQKAIETMRPELEKIHKDKTVKKKTT